MVAQGVGHGLPRGGSPHAPPPELGRYRTQKQEKVTLAAAGTVTLLSVPAGPGVVRNMLIALDGGDFSVKERSLVKVYVDGEATPRISCTLVNLHAADFAPNNAFSARFIGYNTGTGNSYYNYHDIPFSNGVRVDLVNGSASLTGTIYTVIGYHEGVVQNHGRKARLHSVEARTTVTAYATEVLADVVGRGQLWYLYMLFDGGDGNYNYLEGNIRMYIDGETTPSIEWSGTEDYFQNGYYFSGGLVVGSYVGCTKKTSDQVGAYRFHDRDPVTFDRSLRIEWSAGNVAQATVTNGVYCSRAVLYYLDR